MSFKVKDIVGNVFYTERKQKAADEKKLADLSQTVSNVFGDTKKHTSTSFNPFLKSNGELVNPFLNYQKILDNPEIASKTKDYIQKATGLTPTATASTQTPAAAPASSASATGNSIADSAQKYMGTPYVWGGESMSEGGMDCSGFVYNALKDAGYDVGRTTAQGYRSYGSTISKSDMQPGDLIFYGKNGNASHIGIYIGDGKMIHSSGGSKNTKNNPGKGVSISNIDYRSDFIEARRY